MSYKLLCYLQVAQLTLRVAGVVVISQQNAVHSVRVPQARYVVAAGGGEGRGGEGRGGEGGREEEAKKGKQEKGTWEREREKGRGEMERKRGGKKWV